MVIFIMYVLILNGLICIYVLMELTLEMKGDIKRIKDNSQYTIQYWVKYKGQDKVEGIKYIGADKAEFLLYSREFIE